MKDEYILFELQVNAKFFPRLQLVFSSYLEYFCFREETNLLVEMFRINLILRKLIHL